MLQPEALAEALPEPLAYIDNNIESTVDDRITVNFHDISGAYLVLSLPSVLKLLSLLLLLYWSCQLLMKGLFLH